MKILDRYLLKQLVFPIFFCTCTLIFLVFMADVFDNINEMLRNETKIYHILLYYVALTPQTFVQVISWASLLGTIYVLASFNYHNELTAMKVAGMEIVSIVRPVVFVGFALGVITFLVNDRIVPYSSQKAEEMRLEFIDVKPEIEGKLPAKIHPGFR